jgi:hypothetical protein
MTITELMRDMGAPLSDEALGELAMQVAYCLADDRNLSDYELQRSIDLVVSTLKLRWLERGLAFDNARMLGQAVGISIQQQLQELQLTQRHRRRQ